MAKQADTRKARNASFANPQFEPSGTTLTLHNSSVRGPFSFMNPTTAIYEIKSSDSHPGATADLTDAENLQRAKVQWKARDYRKGRHILILPHASPLAARIHDSAHPRNVFVGIGRMFTMCPYWDISYLIGVSFTIGCLIFVVCGLFYWLPIAYPDTEFPGESAIAGGVTAFIGATLFQIGAVLLFLESYNDRAETQFGGAMEHLFVDRLKIARRSRKHRPKHFEATQEPKQLLPGDDDPKQLSPESSKDSSNIPSDTFTERTWQWLPTWHDFTTHYIYEVGFLASLTMSIGATIFYVSGIMALPGIYNNLSEAGLKGGYYFTYLFGGVLFAVSSALYILETQPNWYTPQPTTIGWHIGFWNMIGSIGWTLAASFGYCKQEWCEYQSELTLVWASAAFALGSAFQWYESLDKYVVVIEDRIDRRDTAEE